MAFSLRKRVRCAVVLLGLALASAGAAQTDPRSQPIRLDAASSEFDYRTNQMVLRDVEISQGDITVRAERAEATGLDFENSRWTFLGNVRIDAETSGNLRSERALVEFRNNRMSRAVITGSPAVFEHHQQSRDLTARGRAGAIEYRVSEGTVRLSDDAWLSDGRNEISGPVLVYNIRQELWQAAAPDGASERVRITILPKQDEQKDQQP